MITTHIGYKGKSKMKNKVTVLVQGGIGNQLFTYACAYCIAQKYDAGLWLDLLPYESGYFRSYQLDRLNIVGSMVRHWLPKGIIYKVREKFISHVYDYVKEIAPYKFQMISNIERVQTVSRVKFPRCKLYLEGYWQSEKYFKEMRQELLKVFSLTVEDDKKIVETFFDRFVKDNVVAVHVRRGDFVSGGASIASNYYRKAFEEIKNRISNPEFLFFSDDIEYVKKEFKNDNIKMKFFTDLFELQDDLLTLFCMSKCPHLIIANSSFSWWAAWLNCNDDKVVIAPSPDYLKSTDYYPADWTILDSKCGI